MNISAPEHLPYRSPVAAVPVTSLVTDSTALAGCYPGRRPRDGRRSRGACRSRLSVFAIQGGGGVLSLSNRQGQGERRFVSHPPTSHKQWRRPDISRADAAAQRGSRRPAGMCSEPHFG